MLKNIIYPNLQKELDKRVVKIKDIASFLNISEKTVRNYLNGITPITLSYAIKIQKEFFNDVNLTDLFRERND
ncbi:hypothetical protein JJB75_09605 [Clostridium perfringens]|uniref:helix-turn-helix domain-containing protein n=1 Tax=Clostridium perfringens TaxID=1502 RepID=UPI000D70BFFB|nr:helix-turn-helix transcriptional regulator [Clostridium perfringens]KAB8119296.1 XRE family transcriptional regulator [Clostridium perfringens]MBO3303535.1 hypothetical protein [Clostridium perfringens]MBO3306987.1 hypothetical protein [Clostridium perfringens]MBO3310231.1 hypothetical protein [Clostridium perfringens]MBO3316394.1 hypothetical protein [Clostridium perfringens]